MACRVLEAFIEACPYRLPAILTVDGLPFAGLPKNRRDLTALHRVGQIDRANDIEHRLTRPNHPWLNGRVERMNRTLEAATIKRLKDGNPDQRRTYPAAFPEPYKFARRLETLRGPTP